MLFYFDSISFAKLLGILVAMLSCGENPLTYLLSQPAADGLIEKAKSRIRNGDG